VQHPEGEAMASTSHEPPTSRKKHPVSAALHTLEKNVQPLVAFWTKFNNDWSWNNAAGLAYNLILAVFPIVITLLPILGFFLSTAPQKKGPVLAVNHFGSSPI
jgi:uncharacterized BrkB/YihY/UPF0761 family membrane protein